MTSVLLKLNSVYSLLPLFAFKLKWLPYLLVDRVTSLPINAHSAPYPITSYNATSIITNTEIVNVVLIDSDLVEKFVRGSGKGGQKVNKAANRVQLEHLPTGIKVSCHDARDLSTNRKIARKMLIEKLDQHYNGANSRIEQEFEKIRKRKQNLSR